MLVCNAEEPGLAKRLNQLSKPSKRKIISGQKLFGMQVIDVKGTLVGSVRDVGVDVEEKQLILFVTTRAKIDVEVPWGSVQSMEDVVLLNKEVEVPMIPGETQQPSAPTPPPVAKTACPKCGFAPPEHAKFCPKCGSSLR